MVARERAFPARRNILSREIVMTRIASLVSCTVLAAAMLVAPAWGQEELEADEGTAIIHSGGESHVFTVEIADDDATARGPDVPRGTGAR